MVNSIIVDKWLENLTCDLSIPVEGMTCASCSSRIEGVIGKLPGIGEARVNLATELADVSFNPATLGPSDIVDAIVQAGFKVPPQTYELSIDGMTCASCVGRVEKVLVKHEGVRSATVNLATEKASVSVDFGTIKPEDLIAAVQKTGFGAAMVSREDD